MFTQIITIWIYFFMLKKICPAPQPSAGKKNLVIAIWDVKIICIMECLLCIFIFILYLLYIGFWSCVVYYMVSIMYNPIPIYIYYMRGGLIHSITASRIYSNTSSPLTSTICIKMKSHFYILFLKIIKIKENFNCFFSLIFSSFSHHSILNTKYLVKMLFFYWNTT